MAKQTIEKRNVIASARNLIYSKNYQDINEALTDENVLTNLISSMLFAAGYHFVEKYENRDSIRFLAGTTSDNLEEQIIYSRAEKRLRGDGKKLIEKTYHIVRAIEHQLTSASLLPPKLRENAIERICLSAGADKQFYQNVLLMWSH